jgi:uncharacterized protein
VNSYPSIKQSLGIFGIALAIMIITLPIYFLIPDQEAGFLCHYVISMGGSIYLVVFIRNKRHRTTSFDLRVNNLKIVPWILIATAGLVYGLISPIVSLIPMTDFFRQVFVEMFGRTGILSFAAIVIAAPILEEVLFRGIILDGFLKRYSPMKSIVISALLFGAFHLNPWQFVGAFLLGTMMGWIYYRTGSLALTIVIHFFNNFAAFASMKFTTNYEELIDQSIVEYYGGLLPFLTVVGISLAALAYAIYELNRRMTHQGNLSNDHPVVPETVPETTDDAVREQTKD